MVSWHGIYYSQSVKFVDDIHYQILNKKKWEMSSVAYFIEKLEDEKMVTKNNKLNLKHWIKLI